VWCGAAVAPVGGLQVVGAVCWHSVVVGCGEMCQQGQALLMSATVFADEEWVCADAGLAGLASCSIVCLDGPRLSRGNAGTYPLHVIHPNTCAPTDAARLARMRGGGIDCRCMTRDLHTPADAAAAAGHATRDGDELGRPPIVGPPGGAGHSSSSKSSSRRRRRRGRSRSQR
jgi:hypothetical protein